MAVSEWKPGKGQKIERLYAWVATEPDGGEGVCGMTIPELGGLVPLVGADRERIESLRIYAEQIRKASGCPTRLVEFSTRIDGDELP
jgi:hypothetical protein